MPALALATAACGLPLDPEQSLERARGGTLRVGAVASPAYLARSGDAATGPEADVIYAFAREIDATVHWRWGSQDRLLEDLAEFELDLVAAGLTAASPWKGRVGLTRPWRKEGARECVLAVPPGENALLQALERVIESRGAAQQ